MTCIMPAHTILYVELIGFLKDFFSKTLYFLHLAFNPDLYMQYIVCIHASLSLKILFIYKWFKQEKTQLVPKNLPKFNCIYMCVGV